MGYSMSTALKEICTAKERIISGDYASARKKLLEIETHLPAFDNISGMIAVCDVLISAEFEFLCSGPDYFWILEVPPTTSERIVQAQFKRFSKLLEPIKSNFPGAVSALKILEDAFAVLSNPEKRSVFAAKRARKLQSFGSGDCRAALAVDSLQGYFPSANKGNTSLTLTNSVQEAPVRKEMSIVADVPLRTATNDALSDYHEETEGYCVQPIQAIGIPTGDKHRALEACATAVYLLMEGDSVAGKPANNTASTFGGDALSLADEKFHMGYYNFDDNRKIEGFSVAQVWAINGEEGMPRNYAQIVNIKIHESPVKLYVNWFIPAPTTTYKERCFGTGLPFVCGLFNLCRKKTNVVEPASLSHMVSPQASEQLEIYPKIGEIWAIYKDCKPFPEAQKGYTLEFVEIVIGYSEQDNILARRLSKVEGFKNVYGRCSTASVSKCALQVPARNLQMFSHRVPAYKFTGGEMDGILEGMFELDPLAVPGTVDCLVSEGGSSNFSSKLCNSILPQLLPEVGELPSHKWSANDFVPDRIWAVYDGPDSMPRRYAAVVNNLVSGNKVCVTFLEPHPLSVAEVQWVENCLPFVCGLFKRSKTTVNLRFSKFSHIVRHEQNEDLSLYSIVPKRGEVWAMYQGWSSRWTYTDFMNHRCQIVEIVTDFSEESGLVVASLQEVPGFTTFFQRHVCDGFELVRAIPVEEMLSFSHQIPAYTVPGVEAYSLPESSWHLELNALPSSTRL